MAEAIESRVGDENAGEESHWSELAQKHWPKPTSKTKKVKADVIKKEIWDVLEGDAFDVRSLLELERLQLLEKYGAFNVIGNCHTDNGSATCGQAILMGRQIFMSSSLHFL